MSRSHERFIYADLAQSVEHFHDYLTIKNKVPQTVVYLPIFDVADNVTTKLVLMSHTTKQQSHALRQKQCDGYSLTEYPFDTIFEGI